eukprot:CAMPEP_0196816044 /NCGR_PEP_ID=MMETSP1362-20130617/53253_1 /TAXON_ID=163516 /ORGANISM="Leptocylindrus danicus, Strain CCMP1856" /LENGTH=72 /DNA_ID=CAMNT_0042193235 /DNA_START=403 /DNA_END=621 /DNA_ORIENTATION=-
MDDDSKAACFPDVDVSVAMMSVIKHDIIVTRVNEILIEIDDDVDERCTSSKCEDVPDYGIQDQFWNPMVEFR